MPMEIPKRLWEPSPERIERAALTSFARANGLPEDYASLWRWSVDDVERFWGHLAKRPGRGDSAALAAARAPVPDPSRHPAPSRTAAG